MPVDPPIQRMLDLLAAMRPGSMASASPAEARQAFRMLTVELRDPATIVPCDAVEEIEVPGAAGPLRARIYRPAAEPPLPTVVFIHGGGFVLGDVETHDNQCRTLANQTGAVVLSSDYRLAPEARFPAALDDALAITRWAAEHVDELGGDPERLAIAGDSAGGNLAAVVAHETRETGPRLAAQLLIYPGTDFVTRHPSEEENAEGYFLTLEDMEWFADHYTGDADRTDPRLSPALADDLAGLPPAVIATAEFDPLRDQGNAYADALQAAGVPVVKRCYPGLIHGFFDLAALSPAAAAAVGEVCADLRALLAGAAARP
ncbi:MAG: alpha/beta hydrolase [Thermoleophilaceae bacterium]|nr:alpha/beta hydrolase [Thermoleophilaceae bacterium]